MAVHINKRISRWMQTARRFSWVLALCMMLNQSLILFENNVIAGSSQDLFSLGIAILPSQAPCTLNKLNNRNVSTAFDRALALVECSFFTNICDLPVPHLSKTFSFDSLIFYKTELHLRV